MTTFQWVTSKIVKQFSVTPSIDLLASHLNKQERYASWHPDQYCYAVDGLNFFLKKMK